MHDTPPLHAAGVSYTYPGGDRPALDAVDLTVDPGECVALLGPNGAGKTTLISTATGLLAPDAGTVRVAGGDPARAATRLHLGVMLQETAFPPHLTVAELVRGAAVRAGLPADAAGPVLDEVGMADLGRRRSGKLSGGQGRRLALARAIVTDPSLLVLDEPTEGLDAAARKDFWTRLAARRDAGMAVLLTTHLIEEAGAVADRVVVISEGRIVADADPGDLADRLPDRRVQLRTTTRPEAVRALDGVIDVQVARAADGPPLLRIVTRSPEALVRTLLLDDPAASDLRVEGASLSEAVMAMTDGAIPTTLEPTR